MNTYAMTSPSKESIEIIYNWKVAEPDREGFSCRPIKPIGTFEDFYENYLKRLNDPKQLCRIFIDSEKDEVLGGVFGFDYNERNHSIEFGYYLPGHHRAKGYGKLMVTNFLKEAFENQELKLNKIYATTSENNAPSKCILEKLGFKLDGKNREHYWIQNARYDQYVYSLLASEWIDQL